MTVLSEHLGWNTSTLFHLLSTLKEKGYVEQDVNSKRYFVGYKIADLYESYIGQESNLGKLTPFLDIIADKTGETSHLAVLYRDEIYIARSRVSQKNLRVNVQNRQKEIVHCTAVGKAILAFMDKARIKKMLKENGLTPSTKNTITDYDVLLAELAEVKKKGYAVDNEEFMEGVRCMAVPVFAPYDQHRPVAAVGISGPAVRVKPKWIRDHASFLIEVGKKCTQELKTSSEKEV